MKIKAAGYSSTVLNRFDLLGHDERGLAKAFAYLMAKEPLAFFSLAKDLGISLRRNPSIYENVQIEIERKRAEGRTDIEVLLEGKFHIIIECKVGLNRLRAQRYQYLGCFSDVPRKTLCFITEERDSNFERATGVAIHYRGWLDILDLVDQGQRNTAPVIDEFMQYATRAFKMKRQKEILIQDLGRLDEIERYRTSRVYRRDVTFGSPMYFAPYFTRASGEAEGISSLSRVMGVLTAKGKDIPAFRDELMRFAGNNRPAVDLWLSGVDATSSEETYYFLAEPVTLPKPLMKDPGRKKGRGKGWIAAKIPKNRCVPFDEFTRRIGMTISGE